MIEFDDGPEAYRPLNGQYPANAINWGSGVWFMSGPWGQFTTKSISFNGTQTTGTFTFISPKVLVALDAYNGGNTTTITLSCAGNTTKVQQLSPGGEQTIATGWSNPCTTVTVGSTNGWDTNFDNLAIH